MCDCKLCKICGKPTSLKEDCPEHQIKNLVPSHNLANGPLCSECEKQIVAVWFERHGISIDFSNSL